MALPSPEAVRPVQAIRCDFSELVGQTPVVRLVHTSADVGCDVYAKLEGANPAGSVKDRPASYILRRALQEGLVDRNSLVVESTSGNFGVALAASCQSLGLRLVCVVDPNVAPTNRYLIERLGATVEMVARRDPQGGYLGARLDRVRELLREEPGAFWTNQYANEWNWMAHYVGTGRELADQFADAGTHLDYFFAAVSSGGTITGCARALRERFPDVRVVAVDVKGSVIFGGPSGPRHVPGPGSSRVPEILDRSLIDDVVHVDEISMIAECRRLLRREGLFVGGSSGAVVRGVRDFFARERRVRARCPVVAVVFPDRGERYFDSIYDDQWVGDRYGEGAERRAADGNGTVSGTR
jgi:cysteine synthase A